MILAARSVNRDNTRQASLAKAETRRARAALTPAAAYLRRWVALAVLAIPSGDRGGRPTRMARPRRVLGDGVRRPRCPRVPSPIMGTCTKPW